MNLLAKYYSILGLAENASIKAIKKAYRSKAKQVHPDRNPSPNAEAEFIELNEAFASQSIACMQELEMDAAKINVNGGSIAIGHPLGCSGARISTTLLHEMKKQTRAKYGLATMCIGVGQGSAVIYERL